MKWKKYMEYYLLCDIIINLLSNLASKMETKIEQTFFSTINNVTVISH